MSSPVDAAKGPQLEELPTTEPDRIQVLPVVNFTVLDVLDVRCSNRAHELQGLRLNGYESIDSFPFQKNEHLFIAYSLTDVVEHFGHTHGV